MQPPTDHYALLQVSPDASEQSIRSAYRRLAAIWHPDKNPGDRAAAERMILLNAAYGVLSDGSKRREYDARRRPPVAGRVTNEVPARPTAEARQPPHPPAPPRPTDPPVSPLDLWVVLRGIPEWRQKITIQVIALVAGTLVILALGRKGLALFAVFLPYMLAVFLSFAGEAVGVWKNQVRQRERKEGEDRRRKEAEDREAAQARAAAAEQERQRDQKNEGDRQRRQAEERAAAQARAAAEEHERQRRQREAEELHARAWWARHHESKTMDDVARMTGSQFERFLARLLARMWYTAVTLTKTNDQGADLLCVSPAGTTVAVQAKRWAGPVGNSAVQELLGAMVYYGRAEGLVVTNSRFTTAARELARRDIRITLHDGQWLSEQIRQYLSPTVPEFDWDEYRRLVAGGAPRASPPGGPAGQKDAERRQDDERLHREAECHRQEEEARQVREKAAAERGCRERAERLEGWKRSGLPEVWAAGHLDRWGPDDWAVLVRQLWATPYWPLDEVEVARHLGTVCDGLRAERDRQDKERAERAEAARAAAVADRKRAERLEQWKESDVPLEWVERFPDGWGAADWAEFLRDLQTTEYWPLDTGAVARHLGELWEELRVNRDRRVRKEVLQAIRRVLRERQLQACEGCNQEPAVWGERYCKKCRAIVLTELRESGYLTRAPLYPGARTRPRSSAERESRDHSPSPWQDNAIRALEGD